MEASAGAGLTSKKAAVPSLLLMLLLLATVVPAFAADTLAVKCSPEFQKVTDCLPFATAKADAPSKACCDSVTEIKDRDPACLCFLIEQIHNGTNSALKSMGIQEGRLLQLPGSCNLANASISDCPTLLNLDPKSPDAAIFANSSTAATSSPSTTTTAAPAGEGGSSGVWRKPQPIEVQLLVSMLPMFLIFSLSEMK